MNEQRAAAFAEHRNEGEVRTDLHCHACSRSFIALVDYSIDGNHRIECPHCMHIHYRTIRDGVVTGDRWSSDSAHRADVQPRRIWKSSVIVAETTSASHFLRERWLNRMGGG